MARNVHTILKRLLPRNALSWLLFALCLLYLVSCNRPQTVTVNPPVENPAPVEPPQSNSNWKIGLDPGHGWKGDSGAVGNGLQEKDVTLIIAVLTKSILESNGFQVIMTRTGDDEHDLTHAAKVINEQNPNIAVSIHANSGGSNATGTEACYTVGKSTDTESQALASLLTDSISTKLSLANRGIFPENSDSRCARKKSTGWNQLYIHDMNPPAVIIETAFISNPNDADLLKNRSQDFAQAIADGIMAYVQTKGAPAATPVIVSSTTATLVPVPTTPIPTPIGGESGKIIYTAGSSISVFGRYELKHSLQMADLDDKSSEELLSPAQLENLLPKTVSEDVPYRFILSPTGTKLLVYICVQMVQAGCRNENYIISVDLTSKVQIKVIEVRNVSWKWSPDGTKLVGRAWDDGGAFVGTYIVNSDGSGLRQLSSTTYPSESDRYWSLDGTKMYWERSGILRVMNSDGSGEKGIDIGGMQDDALDLECMQFSPDGKQVAFLDRNGSKFPLSYQLYIASADFTSSIFLYEFSSSHASCNLAWSPDQQYIFVDFTNLCDEEGSSTICRPSQGVYIFKTDTGEQVNIPTAELVCGWSPDSKLVLIDVITKLVDLSNPLNAINLTINDCPLIWLPNEH